MNGKPVLIHRHRNTRRFHRISFPVFAAAAQRKCTDGRRSARLSLHNARLIQFSVEKFHHPDQRLAEYRAEDQENREIHTHLHQTMNVIVAVKSSDAFPHSVDPVSKRHKRIQIIEKARRQLYRERSSRAGDLYDQKHDINRLPHIPRQIVKV